jgi:hypothetical protein
VSTAVGNPGDLLHVHMDQLSGPVALIAADRFRCCAVTAIETPEPLNAKDPLHR